MSERTWLSKGEVNSLFYNEVAGEIVFATEGRWGYHPGAVANLIVHQAAALGKRSVRVLEIGANNCAFAGDLLEELRERARDGISKLERVDYLAVEFARNSLEAAIARVEQGDLPGVVRRGPAPPPSTEPPAKPTLIALVTTDRPHPVNLGLVHADALQFLRSTNESFDFVILNELLDDLPCHVFYADADGRRFEAVPAARAENGGWRVRVSPEPATAAEPLDDLPAGAVTARSRECVELVTAVAGLLQPGGVLLVHDYGFPEPHVDVALYAPLQEHVPAFVAMEFPRGSESGFPRSFFRVFGNDRCKVVQVTNDVNFAELSAALENQGAVTVIGHGSMIYNRRGHFERGDGVFLSEFGLLEPRDDLPALLDDLHANQKELRDRFVRDYLDGRPSAFMDLIFVKAAPTGM
jgi:SAM-dependent methyltransferase